MAWVAVGMIGGALIGGVSQNMTNKQNAKAAKNAGKVDVVTTRTGDPRADPYREAGMQAAYNALFPGHPQPVPATAGTPMGGGGGGGRGGGGQQDEGDLGQFTPIASPSSGKKAAPPTGKRYNAKGKLVDARNPATPGGGTTAGPAAPADRKFDGMSQETADIRKEAMALDNRNAGMYDEAESFATDTMRGDTRNPLIGRATEAADLVSEDPGLAEYIATLKGNAAGGSSRAPGRTGTGGGGQGGRYVTYGGSGAVGAGGVPAGGAYSKTATGTDAALKKLVAGEDVATATGTNAALRKLVAGEKPAGWDEMEAGIARKVNEGRAGNIRELRARAVGSGFYGGDLYKDLESGAIAKGDQEMTDSLGAARFSAYQNALGLGSEYDRDVLGLGTQYDLGMANIAASERSASAAAGAGARAQSDELASREKLAMMGMWGDALGMGQQGRSGRAAALGDLAGLTSEDQRFAFSGVNDLGGSRRGDVGVAGDISLGADSNRNAFRASENNLAGVRAGVNLGRAELGFDKERFYDPLSRTGAYADVLNGLFGGYGSERTVGQDQRAAGGGGYSSPWGAAMTGAALGGQIGSQYGKSKAPTTGGP
jgi:hypothetical protein